MLAAAAALLVGASWLLLGGGVGIRPAVAKSQRRRAWFFVVTTGGHRTLFHVHSSFIIHEIIFCPRARCLVEGGARAVARKSGQNAPTKCWTLLGIDLTYLPVVLQIPIHATI